MKKYTINSWFTLVELIVSIAIFGIIMTSVLAIFLFSSQMSTRVELNRIMQENIKNVMEDIAEGVRKDGVLGVRDFWWTSCILPTDSIPTIQKKMFCSGTSEYSLGTKQSDGSFVPVSNIWVDCGDINDPTTLWRQCYIIKKDITRWEYFPLTNSFVTFEDIQFSVTNSNIKKLTVQLTVRPAVKKWLASDLVRASTVQVQTTISERSIKTK